jgi:hypothetical protein
VNDRFKPRWLFVCLLAIMIAAKATTQSYNYRQINLVSGIPGLGLNLDPTLVRPWGIALSSAQPFRVANNTTGNFRSYDATGGDLIFAGDVAVPRRSTLTHARPFGIGANSTKLSAPRGSLASLFLWATEGGAVSGEYADAKRNILATTILAIDNSARGAACTEIAALALSCCAPFLAVAHFHGGFIDSFTGSIDMPNFPSTFTDSSLPAGETTRTIVIVRPDGNGPRCLPEAVLPSAIRASRNWTAPRPSAQKRYSSRMPLHGRGSCSPSQLQSTGGQPGALGG